MSYGASTTSNIDKVIAAAEAQMPKDGTHTGEVINTADYAKYLHDRVAYWVLNDSVLAAYFDEELRRAVREASAAGELFSDARRTAAEKRALKRTVDFYQSVIGTADTPGKVKPPPRPTRAGGYSDDTETLVGSYESLLRSGAAILHQEKHSI
jgi:hypothetical protein